MKLKFEFMPVDLADEIVAVPVNDDRNEFSGVFRLNEEGLEILNCLTEDTTIERIVDQLEAKYENSHEELTAYVASAIDSLRALNMIEE